MPGRYGRILIVEDEDALRELMKVAVSERGYAVETAQDGLAAMRALERGAWTLRSVILDLGLPDLSGRMVLQRAKQLRHDLPVIVAADSRDVVTSPADRVVRKPFGPQDLFAVLDVVAPRTVGGWALGGRHPLAPRVEAAHARP